MFRFDGKFDSDRNNALYDLGLACFARGSQIIYAQMCSTICVCVRLLDAGLFMFLQYSWLYSIPNALAGW